MSYVSTDVAASFRGSINLGIFFRLDTDPALHLWLGVNDVPIGIPGIDASGTVYLGAGRLLDIPALDVLLNGQAARVEIGVAGVDADFMAKLNAEAPPVKSKECNIGIARLDDRFQPATQIIPMWTGYADFWAMRQTAAQDQTRGPVRIVTLSAGTGDTTRSRPRRVTWTASMQRLFYPDDAFCDRVSRYVHTFVVQWPHFRSGN
jgi:hypothetical protein